MDVLGGLSRLAGSALGGSEGGSVRPGSPTGISSGLAERRSSGSTGTTSGSTGRLTEENTLAYTVRGSDTLTSLAARFDTTPSELVAINKLSSRLIFPGQVCPALFFFFSKMFRSLSRLSSFRFFSSLEKMAMVQQLEHRTTARWPTAVWVEAP